MDAMRRSSSQRGVLFLAITGFVLVNVLSFLFWRQYERTLGHPLRWDAPSFVEWDCFYNDCETVNSGPRAP